MIKINGHFLDIDFSEELDPYVDQFKNLRIRGNKIQSCSPFRHENHPSFAVNLENGLWIDSGASDESARKGNFIRLLSFLRDETYEETSIYLLDKYSTILNNTDELELKINLCVDAHKDFNVDTIRDKTYPLSKYLENRGVDFEIQKIFNIKQIDNAVAMPWHDKTGNIINIKYRDVRDKKFWYEKNGDLISNHVYGLWMVIENNIKRVWAVESEIDCLYLWSLDIPAIAFGHGAITDRQRTLILNSCIDNMIVATDNDVVGHRFADVLKDEFTGWIATQRIKFPKGIKDVNEMSKEEIKNVVNNLGNDVTFTIE